MHKLYSATVTNNNQITVFDVQKGVRAYSISLNNSTLITGPIITQDKMTIVVKTSQNKNVTKVYSLKSGVLSYSFTV